MGRQVLRVLLSPALLVSVLVLPQEALAKPCGNGNVQTNRGEECDDRNGANGDGCSARCQIEDLFEFAGEALGGSVALRVDGRNLLVLTRPGDSAATVASSAAAKILADPVLSAQDVLAGSQGPVLSTEGSIESLEINDAGLAGVNCGDGVLDLSEECDDGNLSDGDGCFSTCQVESSLELFGTAQGGGLRISFVVGELDVATEAGQTASDVVAAIAGAIELDELLGSRGLHAAGVGSRLVTTDPVAQLKIEDPGIGTTPCGDGVLDAEEECDDANGLSGDGCSFLCQIEAPDDPILIEDLLPGPVSSFPIRFTAVGPLLYFTDRTDKLYRSDGTAAGTFALPISGGPDGPSIAALDERTALFSGYDGERGVELWRTDGTPEGTRFVKNIAPDDVDDFPTSSDPEAVGRLPGRLLIQAEDPYFGFELWVTDGTEEGTVEIGPHLVVSGNVATLGDVGLFFENNLSSALYRTDGTAEGTFALSSDFFVFGPLVATDTFVLIPGGNEEYGEELWRSDGTAAGTELVVDLVPGPEGAQVFPVARLGDRVLLRASQFETGTELWVSDGTAAGTVLVRDIAPGPASSLPTGFFVDGDVAYFRANDQTHGSELWRSDGTEAGTLLVADLDPGPGSSSPSSFVRSGELLLFLATTPERGRELWQTDGTGPGTRPRGEVVPGPEDGNASGLVVAGPLAFFSADVPSVGRELWAAGPLVCGNGVLDAGEQCDDRNLQAGDGCYTSCQLESQVEIFGLGTGGSVNLLVDRVRVHATSPLGTDASGVAARLAEAINADSELQAAGVSASAVGHVLVSDGDLEDLVLDDLGLSAVAGPLPIPLLALVPFSGVLSSDGRALAGVESGMAAIWTIDAGVRVIEHDPRGFGSGAAGVSVDRSVVAGCMAGRAGNQGEFEGFLTDAFRWTEVEGRIPIAFAGRSGERACASDLSDDGSVIVGSREEVDVGLAWIFDGGRRDLGFGSANAVSGDGTTIVGRQGTEDDGFLDAIRWTPTRLLLPLPPTARIGSSSAEAASQNGRRIGGHATLDAGRTIALLWTDGELQVLGNIPGEPAVDMRVADISGDGSLVLGNSDAGPFLWDDAGGSRLLHGVLEELGLDLTGWTLSFAQRISVDGRTIQGIAEHPGGTDTFLARIPAPAP